MVTTAQRVLWGRVGAAIARSRHDPRDLTAAARQSFLARFEDRIREEYPDLPGAEVTRRAAELRKAHMLRLAALSAAARNTKKAATVRKSVTAQEVDRASDHTTAPRS